jgi:muramidase (phage lysozyme)
MMTTIASEPAGGPQITAFMDMLAMSEGTSMSPITQCDGYDVIVTGVDGRHRFDDFSTHPFASGRSSIVVNSRGLTSNASGRYQHMLKDWAHYRDLLRLPDFGPLSQDRWCIQLLKERGVIQPLLGGDLATAVARCSNIWASLPGNNYGQPQHALDTLRAAFIFNGGFTC